MREAKQIAKDNKLWCSFIYKEMKQLLLSRLIIEGGPLKTGLSNHVVFWDALYG